MEDTHEKSLVIIIKDSVMGLDMQTT